MTNAVVIATHAVGRLYVPGLVKELVANCANVELITFFNGNLLSDTEVRGLENLGVSATQFGPQSQVARFRALRSAFSHLREILSSSPSNEVYFPNPNEALTNWLAFDPKTREEFGVRLHLTPEGISNFYMAKVTQNDRQSTAYRLACKMAGIPFSENRGLVLGLGAVPYEDYWYCGDPGIMGKFMPLNRFAIDKPVPCEPIFPDRWLFLGQPGSGLEFEAAYAKLLRSVIERSDGRADYKPHPHEAFTDARRRQISEAGFVVRQTAEAAELLCLSYGTVCGVLSSGAFNVRMLDWHQNVWGVLDLAALSSLTGRSRVELEEITSAATAVGVKPLPLGF